MTDEDRKRLCRALKMDPIGQSHLFDDGAQCIKCLRPFHQCRPGYCDTRPKILPPVDTDPAWAVKVMEAAAERDVFFRCEALIRANWDVWPRAGGSVKNGTFPAAVTAALWAAYRAGAFGGES